MKSYGEFKNFEVRSSENVMGEEIPYSYDLVVWGDKRTSCFTIAMIKWDSYSRWFDMDMCGTRYLEYGTEELGKWLLAWCSMMSVKLVAEEK